MTKTTTSSPSNEQSPADVIERFAALIGEGNLEGALALYEEDAAFVPEPGRIARGKDQVRAALEPFAAMHPEMTGEIEKVVTTADTALVVNAWTLLGEDPSGGEVRMSAKSADVLRRRDDGSWGILIDDPWGGGN